MPTSSQGEEALTRRTTVERRSDVEVVVTRTFDASARLVFEAWSRPELFQRWWVPRSMGMELRACEMDVRTGGTYRLDFGDGMAFFGRYIEVTPPSLIVWTNEEAGADCSVTTVTFEELDGRTLVVMTEEFPSKEALDAAGTGDIVDRIPARVENVDARQTDIGLNMVLQGGIEGGQTLASREVQIEGAHRICDPFQPLDLLIHQYVLQGGKLDQSPCGHGDGQSQDGEGDQFDANREAVVEMNDFFKKKRQHMVWPISKRNRFDHDEFGVKLGERVKPA